MREKGRSMHREPFPANDHPEGPVPLGPGETWSLVKDLRWRLFVNRLKIAWRERKRMIIGMTLMYSLILGTMMLAFTADDPEPSPYTVEDEKTEEYTFEEFMSDTVEDRVTLTLFSILAYMFLLIGGAHAFANVSKITFFRKIDLEHFYAAPIDRTELVNGNFNRILALAGLYSLGVFLVFLPLAIHDSSYLLILGSYCIFNFFLGACILIIQSHLAYLKRRNTAMAGGILAPSIIVSPVERSAVPLILIQPFLLVLLIWQPIIGLILLLLFIRSMSYFKHSVALDTVLLWHEDVTRIGPPLQTANRRYPGSMWGASEGREIPHIEKWYNRGIFDKKRYSLKEEGYGYEAVKEVNEVVFNRRTYRLPIRLSVISVLITIATAVYSIELAFLPAMITLYIGLFAYLGSLNIANRAVFETTYLLPISGKEIIDRKVKLVKMITLIIGGVVLAVMVLDSGPDSIPIIESLIMTGVMLLFLSNLFCFMIYFGMKDMQHFHTNIQEAFASKSIFTFILMTFYILGLILSQFFIIILLILILDSMELVFALTLILDAFLLVYSSRFFVRRAVRLYDTISILR